MSKKRKIVVVCISVLLLIPILLWFVTDYFIDYALMRSDSNNTLAVSMKSSKPRTQLSATQEKVAQWLTEITPIEMETTSFDGLNLWAMSYTQEKPSDLWLIGVHGYQSSYSSIEDVAMECYKRGYNVILPDLRGHGNSEGDYIGMGFHDSYDIISWVDVIVEQNPQAKIALYGLSMGGATVMITAGQGELTEHVFAVVEDCGYSEAYAMIEEQLDTIFNLPAFPLLPITNLFIELRINYSIKDASPLKFLEFATVPILFIHGADDKYVLPQMQEILYQSYEGEKEILTIESAGHTSSRRVGYDEYYDTLFAFLEKYQ